METDIRRFTLLTGAKEVTAELMQPQDMIALITLAHGAGAGMDHPFMTGLANALAEHRIGSLRFNFPFLEGKKGRPDPPAVAHTTITAALSKALELGKGKPIFAAGKSFGGRMSSQLMAAHPIPDVRGLLFYGFPLHLPGKPSMDRAAHLPLIQVPMLFLQGTRDELAHWDLIVGVTHSLKNATLVRLEGADHAFKMPKVQALPLLALETKKWITNVLAA